MAINPPNTRLRMSHALTIRARGQTVGLIQTWNVAQNRAVNMTFELNSATSGAPVERTPGNMGGLSIAVTRYDLYTKKMEQAFGTADFTMLADQTEKFQVREVWRNPDGSIETFVYLECYFSNIGRNISSTGDRLVMVNATVEYLRRVRVS